jgi:hypothetical protein
LRIAEAHVRKLKQKMARTVDDTYHLVPRSARVTIVGKTRNSLHLEAKHISVPAKRVKGVMDSEKLQPSYFGPYAIAAWHNGCDTEIQRGGERRIAS